MSRGTAVAVIGMACRFPGAPDVERYWRLLRAGAEGISRFSQADLLAAGVDPELIRKPGFVPAMGLIPGSRGFDWSYFGYSRAEAAGIDPQQRVFLECAVAALDDAAVDPTRFPGWIGIYGGADRVSATPDEELGEMVGYLGVERDFLATRVAYKLGLRGPAATVQTACSTSLTAVHMAAASLRGDECDLALAGGVAVMGDGELGYLHEPGGVLSPDGHCRPFDALASGTVPSEGVGVVVLKRLADAERDGDRVLGVLLGSAINNDGSDKVGYTAPSVSGQRDVIRYAQHVAGVDPLDVDYVEAHGTGTRIGDPVEVQALTDVFGPASDRVGWCGLGAVKSNLGHTGSAAGVAGLIKAVLMVGRGELVPTVHFTTPNPLQELETTPFAVGSRLEPWPDRGTRLAAVSSFGVGGTNAHVIVQQPPARTGRAGRGARVLALSGATPEALDRARGALADALAGAVTSGAPGGTGGVVGGETAGASGSGGNSGAVGVGALETGGSGDAVGVGALGTGGSGGPATVAAPAIGDVVTSGAPAAGDTAVVGALAVGGIAVDGIGDTAATGAEVVVVLGEAGASGAESVVLLTGAGDREGRERPSAPAPLPEPLALGDVARTLADRRAHPHRQALVAPDLAGAAELLADPPSTTAPGGLDRVAFLLPGHGVLGSPAGATAHGLLPAFRAAFDELRSLALGRHGVDLTPVVDPAADPRWFDDIVHQQLGLLALGVALGEQLAEWGLRPAALLGNSVGEYPAAAIAGLWSWADAVDLVHLRASGMAATEPGLMAAVDATEELLTDRLAGLDVVLAVRGTNRFVVSGPVAAMETALSRLTDVDVRVQTASLAAHGPLMVPASVELGAAVAAVASSEPRFRLVSNRTGTWARDVREPDYWAGQLRSPVLLEDAVGALVDDGLDTFVELGPGASMLSALRRHPRWRPGSTTIPLLGRTGSEHDLLRALGALWERGVDEALDVLRDPDDRPVSLPTYPFATDVPEAPPARPAATTTRRAGDDPVRAGVERLWCSALGVPSAASADDFRSLGGESLVAVGLLGRVRDELGATVPVTEFLLRPTFGALVDLVRAAGPAPAEPDAVDVVPLAEGQGRPLFLIADASGNALIYRRLAEALEVPVLALEPRHDLGTVEERASRHVDALLRASDGPHAIGGWSFGAVLAHEVARQLTERGERVGPVLLLDAYVRGRPGRPSGSDPGFRWDGARTLLDAALGLGPVGRAVRRDPALRAAIRAKARTLATYRPAALPVRAALFRAGGDRAAATRLAPLYLGGVEVHPVPGDHWSMLAEPHVHDLARRIGGVLANAERTEHVR
ncbi:MULTISPECIES: type I polyketide synthase [Actinosynnema]|uniref:type I polyketide synthase n=1 Tax=Actinosynnema TaxID=40566 RepID=UPI0020A2ABD6|nr:type I polyketide synthase [Actinosynnema pretiosum]MCP2098640.1 Ketoacyl-synthetase C-terminal extension [Actinosynnema pretiosum]